MQKSRRQFSIEIIRCDGFVSMPATAQALYLQLAMSCDDEGFTSSVEMCKLLAHASDEDEKILLDKEFIIQIKAKNRKVTVLKHWRMNNWIRNERVIKSSFAERSKIYVKPNGNYTLSADEGVPLDNREAAECLPSVSQVSDTSQRESNTKRNPTQLNPTQLNSIQKIKPDKTRYKQLALLNLLLESGFVSEDEIDDGWDEYLDSIVRQYGFVDAKMKVQYFLSSVCDLTNVGEDKEGKPVFKRLYHDDGSIANRYTYFCTAVNKALLRGNVEHDPDDEPF